MATNVLIRKLVPPHMWLYESCAPVHSIILDWTFARFSLNGKLSYFSHRQFSGYVIPPVCHTCPSEINMFMVYHVYLEKHAYADYMQSNFWQ